MSISDEIERLNNAKDDISRAITGKGVNIPNTATLSDFSSYISEIPQEGGNIIVDPLPTEDSTNAVSSGGVYLMFQSLVNEFQETINGLNERIDELEIRLGGLSFRKSTTAPSASTDENMITFADV